jgi:ribosomal protein L14E/L6E/L27E
MSKLPAPKKPKVRYLIDIPARVHLKTGKIKITVDIPWSKLEGRLHAPVKAAAKRFRRKRRKAPTKSGG